MNFFIFGIFVMTFLMVIAKRMTALITGFCLQSFFLFGCVLFIAYRSADNGMYVLAGLIFTLKVIAIPLFLRWVIKKINTNEDLGLLVNPVLSLFLVIILTVLSYYFAKEIVVLKENLVITSFAVSLSVTFTGLFIMVTRRKAVAQIVGLLLMENGVFLTATTLCGGMPFLMEIAVFFDIFIIVVILGIFVYRINELFTHIDVNKLTKLRG
ncbi:MAG: hypothetical protein PHE88_07455 [Elusimicrobia bacterium]|nr:hypothetical protein [Elusimicrobiota bacterium]